jgi:hypothetical protein
MSNSAYSEAQPGAKLPDLKPHEVPNAVAAGAKSTVAIDPLDKNNEAMDETIFAKDPIQSARDPTKPEPAGAPVVNDCFHTAK